jgi:ATP-dependent DNA ligase
MLRLRAGWPVGFIEPSQPRTAIKPPAGPGWIHEIKHDGYRMLARYTPPRFLFALIALTSVGTGSILETGP